MFTKLIHTPKKRTNEQLDPIFVSTTYYDINIKQRSIDHARSWKKTNSRQFTQVFICVRSSLSPQFGAETRFTHHHSEHARQTHFRKTFSTEFRVLRLVNPPQYDRCLCCFLPVGKRNRKKINVKPKRKYILHLSLIISFCCALGHLNINICKLVISFSVQ